MIPLRRHNSIVASMSREVSGLREELARVNARCNTLRGRVAFLEKLVNEAPHAPSCVVKYHLRQSPCNCWKKVLIAP